MSLERKLKQWETAQLIDAELAAKIRAYEQAHHRPYALYVFGGLGGLAVVLGTLSVMASNWDEIPRAVKLGVDLLLVGGLGFAVWRLDRREAHWAREMALTLFFGMVLASIALIGQTYQLGGEPWMALLTWSLVTLPAMALFGRSGFVGAATMLALNVAVDSAVFAWADKYERVLHLSVLGVVVLASPLLHLALGNSAWFKSVRPAWAKVSRALGWLVIVGLSLLSQQSWYWSTHVSSHEQTALWISLSVVALLTAGLVFTARSMLPQASPAQVLSWRVFLAWATVAGAAPWVFVHGGSVFHDSGLGAISAVSVIAFLMLGAWFAYEHGHVGLFNVATALVALRTLIVFGEVFSSLLATGLGLIAGGVCVLGMTWLWVRTTRTLRTGIRTREAA